MVRYIKEHFIMVRDKDTDSVFIQTKANIQDNGLITILKVKELKFMPMATSIKVTGRIISETV